MPEAMAIAGRSASLTQQQKTVRAAFLDFSRDNGDECAQVYGGGLDSLKEEVACDEMLVRRFAKWLVEKYTKHDGEFIGGATACQYISVLPTFCFSRELLVVSIRNLNMLASFRNLLASFRNLLASFRLNLLASFRLNLLASFRTQRAGEPLEQHPPPVASFLPPHDQNVENEDGDGSALALDTMTDKKAHVAYREHMAKGGGREPRMRLPTRQQKDKMIYVIDLFNGLAQDDELKLLNKTTRKEDTDMGEQLRLCKKLDKLAVAWLRDQYSEAKAKIPPMLKPLKQQQLAASAVYTKIMELRKKHKRACSLERKHLQAWRAQHEAKKTGGGATTSSGDGDASKAPTTESQGGTKRKRGALETVAETLFNSLHTSSAGLFT